MAWAQNYNPLGSQILSMLAALALVIILVLFFKFQPYQSAFILFLSAPISALLVFRMPLIKLGASPVYGTLYGFFTNRMDRA